MVHRDVSDIVDLETFECEVSVYWMSCSNIDSGCSTLHIVYFDDSKADSDPIPDIFYRWELRARPSRYVLASEIILALCDIFCLVFVFAESEYALQDQVGRCNGLFNVNHDIERYCWMCNNWFTSIASSGAR